jgi:CRISPR-associated protein Csm2
MSSQQNYGGKDREVIKIPAFQPVWIDEGIKAGAIEYAEQLGRRLVDERFTTSQIRNFYGELKRIQLKKITDSKQKSAFHLLHPKLAYAAKRAEKTGSRGATTFKEEILKAHTAVRIDEAKSDERFDNFCDLCEAILAFHKAHGGRD